MKSFEDDKAIFERVSLGEMEAFQILFNRYFSDTCNFLLLYLHSRELCEEVALDVFTYVWEKRESVRIHTSVRNFLLGIARNKAISEYRKEQHQIFFELSPKEFGLAEANSAEDFLESRELQDIIRRAIDDLPEKSKLVYKMAWEEDLSYREIADRLNIKAKTVENHIGIALRKLREALSPYYKQIFTLLLMLSQSK
ncbi:MAG: RNA polymerase sigma-70 factor [Prolixibacteraceae bacterium]